MKKVRVSLVQDAPVLFDLEASLQKLTRLSQAAAAEGTDLILFPEAFLGGYPRGLSFGTVVGRRSPAGREQWLEYWKACPKVDKNLVNRLGDVSRKLKVFLGIGLVEQSTQGSSLYCSFLLFGPQGNLLHHHRKIKPTGTERLIWAEGSGDSLHTVKTELGQIGSLICWENYMPLARMALYEGAMDIHLAPTADSRDSWQASMQHMALEGRCFVLSCNQFVQKKDYPAAYQQEIIAEAEPMCRGGSAVYSPMGKLLVGPLYEETGIVRAELDMDDIARARLDFDVIGHYARPDLFTFHKNKS